MSNALHISELVKVHSVMLSMLEQAVNANWQELNRLDSERRILLENKNDSPVNRAITSNVDYKDWCNKILELDAKINETVVQAKKDLMKESRDLTAQKNAKKGYQNAASMQATTYGL